MSLEKSLITDLYESNKTHDSLMFNQHIKERQTRLTQEIKETCTKLKRSKLLQLASIL